MIKKVKLYHPSSLTSVHLRAPRCSYENLHKAESLQYHLTGDTRNTRGNSTVMIQIVEKIISRRSSDSASVSAFTSRYNPAKFCRQFTIGITVPVAMTKRGGLAFNAGFQLNFVLPWNLTQFEPTVIPARHIRDLELQDTYVAIEDLLNE